MGHSTTPTRNQNLSRPGRELGGVESGQLLGRDVTVEGGGGRANWNEVAWGVIWLGQPPCRIPGRNEVTRNSLGSSSSGGHGEDPMA